MSYAEDNNPPETVTFREAFTVWMKIGFLSFGGPAGQIGLMHKMLVDDRKWISNDRFLHALNYCMLLPGPEAQQLATYMGWLLHGSLGGVVAGTLFVLPGFVVMMGLAGLYAGFHQVALVQGLFYGIKPAVLAVVVEALLRIGGRALTGRELRWVAALAFVAICFLGVPFPLIVLGAAALGGWAARAGHPAFPPKADAPGSGITRKPALRTASTMRAPGSDTAGVPASDISAIRSPACRRSISLSATSRSLCWCAAISVFDRP